MRTADLTPQQLAFFQSPRVQLPRDQALESFRPDPWLPGAIIGTLPHCGLFGLIEANGRIHT
jgi:hypothetical protein